MIELPDPINQEWLHHALSKSHLLEKGDIKSISIRNSSLTFFSNPKIFILNIETSNPKAQLDVVLKMANGLKEYVFLSEIAPVMNNDEIIKCYYSEFNSASDKSFFVLENIETTHDQTDWPIPPTIDKCVTAINCLACIHAFWWDHHDLEDDLYRKSNLGNTWKNRIELAVTHIPVFFNFIGDRLPQERKNLYELVLSSQNQTWLPGNTDIAKTLLHGDAHFWNFMYPIEPGKGSIRIIDWNSWDIGRPMDDLAYMIGLHWYPSRRKVYEEFLLENYHQKLRSCGLSVKLNDLQNEYKKSLIMNLFIPIWQWQKGINPVVWWSHLERSFMAFEDNKCIEML
ncbi:MAG TPA: hypothetical protein DCK95_10220 [Anaerolineaceae bacterium]|nr:hypothetical protein [Anaerolineaceae bacterium]